MEEFIFSKNGTYYKVNKFRRERPALVFIHGLSGSSSVWVEYEKKFENKYNILSFDLRGHGESKKFITEKDYEIEKFVQDIYELLKYLKIEKFVIISHSFGTIIALEFLRRYSNMVSSVILLNPVYHPEQNKGFRYFMFLVEFYIRTINFFNFYLRSGKHIDYSKYINTGDWDIRRLRADITNTTLRVYLYCLRQVYNYRYNDFWSKLVIPVLIVHGKKDTISPVRNARIISTMIKGSELIVLNNANHITVINNFNEVSDAIEKFVR